MATSAKPATRKHSEVLPYRALFRDKLEGMIQSAFMKLTRSLKKRPGGRRRWIYDQAAFGGYRPWRALTEPIDLAIAAGAPIEDVMPLIDALAAYVQAHYPVRENPCIKEALRVEAHLDADADKAQADAAADPTPGNLERVLDATSRHEQAEETLMLACRSALRVVRS